MQSDNKRSLQNFHLRNAAALVKELNNNPPPVAPQIISLIQLANSCLPGSPVDPAKLRQINAQLRSSGVFPELRFPGENGWLVGWRYQSSGFGSATEHWVPHQTAVVIELAVAGVLRQVRSCASCGRWFVANSRRQEQRFCNIGCRQRNYASSTEGRKKRTDYMRGYRARLRRQMQNMLKVSRSSPLAQRTQRSH